MPHHAVIHPATLTQSSKLATRFNDWVTDHLALMLGSMCGLYIAVIVPLIALKVPKLQTICILVFSSWIQSWGLFCLQRSANRADQRRSAKENTDHIALTHLATRVDEINSKLSSN